MERNEDAARSSDAGSVLDTNHGTLSLQPSRIASTAAGRLADSASKKLTGKESPRAEVKEAWIEQEDTDDAPIESASSLLDSQARSKRLPDWARAPIPDRIEGPFVVVRRVVDSNDPAIFPTLHMALDGHIGGTVELADEGRSSSMISLFLAKPV